MQLCLHFNYIDFDFEHLDLHISSAVAENVLRLSNVATSLDGMNDINELLVPST